MGTTPNNAMGVGFAKLKGEDFEFYMQTYSILLGRSSKNLTPDVDLSGGGKSVSCRHACIFYDFMHHYFAMEVLSMNGCYVEGVFHLPNDPPVKLNSQDHICIGKKEFYFLLPSRGIPFHHNHCLATTSTLVGEGPGEAESTYALSSAKNFHCKGNGNDESGEEENDRSGGSGTI